MANIAVQPIDAADHNGSAETQNETLTNRLETVSNLTLAVIPATEVVLDVVRDTDKAISNFTNMTPHANLSELTEDQLVERLNKLTNLSLGLPKMTLFIAVQIGQILLFKKAQLKKEEGSSHGLWMDWQSKNFTAYDDRTARNWMKLAKNADKVKGGALTLKDAYTLLRKPRVTPSKPEAKQPTVAEQVTKMAETVADFIEAHPEQAIEVVVQIVRDFADSHKVKHFNTLFGHLQDIHDLLNAPAVKPVSVGQLKPRTPRKSKAKLNAALLQKEADKATMKVVLGKLSTDLSHVVAPALA